MSFPARIETARLVLRPYYLEDLDEHVAILGNWDVTQSLSTDVPFPYRPEDGEKFIQEAISHFKEKKVLCYAMEYKEPGEHKETGRHIGGVMVFSQIGEVEIGYWMDPDFWGKGFGTEALNAVVEAGFKAEMITCFVAQTSVSNEGSQRVLQKAGFKHAGATPPQYARCGHDGHDSDCSEFYRLSFDMWKNI